MGCRAVVDSEMLNRGKRITEEATQRQGSASKQMRHDGYLEDLDSNRNLKSRQGILLKQ